MTKYCPKCQVVKPRSDFYKNKRDGFSGYCKACGREVSVIYRRSGKAKEASRKHYANNPEYRERLKEYQQSEKGRAKTRKYHSSDIGKAAQKRSKINYIKNHPEKIRAHWMLRAAVKSGKIIKPEQCSECEETKDIHGHHDDYSKPLVVRWLCRKCHDRHHSNQKKILQNRAE